MEIRGHFIIYFVHKMIIRLIAEKFFLKDITNFRLKKGGENKINAYHIFSKLRIYGSEMYFKKRIFHSRQNNLIFFYVLSDLPSV